MLYFNKTGISERADVNKTSTSKQRDTCHCHYWCFLNYSFKFQANVNNRCHDLLIMSMKLSDIFVLNIKGSDSSCSINLIRKNEAANFMIHKRYSKLPHKRYSKLPRKCYSKLTRKHYSKIYPQVSFKKCKNLYSRPFLSKINLNQ